VEVAAPEGDRRRDESADQGHEDGEGERLAPPGEAVHQPEEPIAEPTEAQKPQHREPEDDAEDADEVDGTVVPARPLDLLGVEDLTAAT
jgi:hypothetical protein